MGGVDGAGLSAQMAFLDDLRSVMWRGSADAIGTVVVVPEGRAGF